MAVFTCPVCGLRQPVSEHRLGATFRCRGCDEIATVTNSNCAADRSAVTRPNHATGVAPTWWARVQGQLPAAIEGAVPGALSGSVAGLAAGLATPGPAGVVAGHVCNGFLMGFAIGTVLGGSLTLAINRSASAGRGSIGCRTLLVMGGVVGLLTGLVVDGPVAMAWGAMGGALAAGVWWLVCRLVDRPEAQSPHHTHPARLEPAGGRHHLEAEEEFAFDPEEVERSRRAMHRPGPRHRPSAGT